MHNQSADRAHAIIHHILSFPFLFYLLCFLVVRFLLIPSLSRFRPLNQFIRSIYRKACDLHVDDQGKVPLKLLPRLVHGQVQLVEARVGPGEDALLAPDTLDVEAAEIPIVRLQRLSWGCMSVGGGV